jgi:predicted nucleic acid-binding protein
VGPVRAVLDTNILVDYLYGLPAARDEIGLYRRPLISAVTWMEVMVGAAGDEEPQIRTFLRRFGYIPINEPVAETAVRLRRERRLKLPDAIVLASAVEEGALLVSRNTKDFSADEPGIRVPYRL